MDYYGQSNNENKDRNSVQTRGTTYRDINCKFPMALEIGYSDDLITLTFTPPLPDQERVKGQKLFDYKNQIKSGMSRLKAHDLYTAYNLFIKPALEKTEGKFAGVWIAGGKHVIGIDTGVNLFKDGAVHPCLILIRNVSEARTSADVIVYEFNRSEVLLDYNPTTGKISETALIDAEFDAFMEDLESARDASSKAYIHTARQVDNRYKSTLIKYLDAFAKKAGVPVPTGNNYGGGSSSYSRANIFNSDEELPFDDAPASSMPEPAPSATINDMDQLAAELGM